METQATLVRADGAVELNTKATVNLDIAPIVNPRHTEHDHAFRFYQAVNDFCLDVFGVVFEHGTQRTQYFFHCLVKLIFTAVFCPYGG